MTMKIALIGAPNSGKTELAQQLRHALSQTDRTTLVDDYIAEVEKRSDVVLSHYATYLGNIQAAIGRFEHERKAVSECKDGIVITCGTLVENSVYTATLAYITNDAASGDAPYRMVNDTRANLCMSWLGTLRHDTWDYDLVYYLPLPDDADRWDSVVDQHIPEAAEALGVEYVELPVEREPRVGIVLQEILEHKTAASNELASGTSTDEGAEVGDRPGHLPDVPEQA
jgi:hypothetical protein